MTTDPSIETYSQVQNPSLNREDVLKRKPNEKEIQDKGEVDLENYSSETLNDKTRLEKNPACLIFQENDTGNNLVRNEVRKKDEAGNETRYYVYNIVNKDKKFAAEVGSFVPGEYNADEIDKEISLFLKKGITNKEQIDNIQDAKVGVLAGVISRRDFQEVEDKIRNKKETVTEQQPAVTSIRNTSPEKQISSNESDEKTDKLIQQLTEKYLSESANNDLKKFNTEVLGEMGSSFRKLRDSLEEVNKLDSRYIEDNMRNFIKVYQEQISPKINETTNILSKFSLGEINIDIRKVENEVSSLEVTLSSSTDESVKENIKQKIKNLEELRMKLRDFRMKVATITQEINKIAYSARNNMFENLSEQAVSFKPINQGKVDFENKIEFILRNTQ